VADPRFYRLAGPLSLRRLAEIAGAEVAGAADLDRQFSDVAPLGTAGPDQVSFLEDRKYAAVLAGSTAGACVLRAADAARAPAAMALLIVPRPMLGYARIAAAFYPPAAAEAGIHPRACVDPTAVIGEGVRIEAGVLIGAGAEIGARCRIEANAVIGPGVVLGADGRVGAGATVEFCRIGERAVIRTGARIGQEGFGIVPGPEGHTRIPQLGLVVLGDDVEIGANSTIARGALGDTVIESGTKIDNLVQIGHNVRVGRSCILVAQVGVSGSTTIGDFVMIGGQAGFAGHTRVGDGARVGAKAGIMRDIAAGETVLGSPAVPARQFFRQCAVLARLAMKKEA
jgi:UDP-3-O-[3-hydroxymyristoyl] glucosamine N-acyltransferase